MNKGFVILAQNTEKVDYVKCADALALSIKKHMPNAKVSLITDNIVNNRIYDKIIPLPYGDLGKSSDWKLINDYQVYEASPYEYTIKLEADMFIPKSIDYWWEILKSRDIVISTTIRNFKQEISDIKVYRRFIYDNDLPDTYNAITYFKKSNIAKDFFDIVKNVFVNWESYKQILKCNVNEIATTDFIYAIASHIIGVEKTTLPTFTDMSMVHMKPFISEFNSDKWSYVLIYELSDIIKINTHPQLYPLHYVDKTFADKLLEKYGNT